MSLATLVVLLGIFLQGCEENDVKLKLKLCGDTTIDGVLLHMKAEARHVIPPKSPRILNRHLMDGELEAQKVWAWFDSDGESYENSGEVPRPDSLGISTINLFVGSSYQMQLIFKAIAYPIFKLHTVKVVSLPVIVSFRDKDKVIELQTCRT